MEGRHVGLDFYDLLIEVLYLKRPRAKSWGLRRCLRGVSDTAT
jgi:hypothetical protein